jgi:hypothetical protein
LYSYKPAAVKSDRSDAAEWECYAKVTGTVSDFSFLGDGLCQGKSSKYTQVRAYRGGEIDDQNPLGTIDSVEQCEDFCRNNVEIEDWFFYEEGVSTCKGFNFLVDRCENSSGETRDRCYTNCFLFGDKPGSNRTRESRKTSYDDYTCYVREPGCRCD